MTQFEQTTKKIARRVRQAARDKAAWEAGGLEKWRRQWGILGREIVAQNAQAKRLALGEIKHAAYEAARAVQVYWTEIVTIAGIILTLAW